jgi:hypothetical protein
MRFCWRALAAVLVMVGMKIVSVLMIYRTATAVAGRRLARRRPLGGGRGILRTP